MTSTVTRGTSATGTSQASLPGMGSLTDIKNRDQRPQAPQEEQAPKQTRRERRAAAKAERTLEGGFEAHPHLAAIKPRERMFFRSDYFHVDGSVGCILSFFHDDAARDDFVAFWGVSRIPSGLGEGVTTVLLEQVRRMGEKWVDDRISTAEKLDKLEEQEAAGGTMSSRRKSAKISDDIEQVTAELQDGAAYLHVHNRLLVKAPDLDTLDEALEKINRLYIDRFGTLKTAPYPGEQRQELSTLLAKNEKKRGRGFHFTSAEYAGSYHLVTNGLNDPAGEYVGYMIGDVNNSAVLFDVNRWDHHVVVADSTLENVLGRAHYPDMWGSKISQSALLNNHKVVHIVLDEADLDKLGPRLDSMTARLDMSSGDINMFELFGSKEDELALFPAHLDKIVLMAEQAYETTENDRSIIRGSLKATLTEFYIDKQMWARNAKTQRDRLRLVDIPHTDVPRLQDIVTYFDTEYTALSNKSARDEEMLHAYSVLRLLFKDLLDNQGDLFNTYTADEIDSVAGASRVIYDFSRLLRRGHGVAMAQLVNVIGFAVDSLQLGDVVIIHGAENIDNRVKEYINRQFSRLYNRGGRIAYLYNDVDLMLADSNFSRFDTADWTVLGPMREATVVEYREQMNQAIPPDLERLITSRGQKISYLRRGHTNVVFHNDLALGVNPAREKQRREAAARAGSLGTSEHAEKITREMQAIDRERRLAERSQVEALAEQERQERAQDVRRLPRSERLARSKRTPGTTSSPRRTTSGPRLPKNR